MDNPYQSEIVTDELIDEFVTSRVMNRFMDLSNDTAYSQERLESKRIRFLDRLEKREHSVADYLADALALYGAELIDEDELTKFYENSSTFSLKKGLVYLDALLRSDELEDYMTDDRIHTVVTVGEIIASELRLKGDGSYASFADKYFPE